MATTLAWQDRFSVGVHGIDRQHRELLARLNALFEAIASGAPGDELESLVAFLKEYAHTHFACEERLMRWHGYPGYAHHLAEHQRFIDELGWIDAVYERTGASERLAACTLDVIATWLAQHFQREDRALADYLRAGGALLHVTPRERARLRGTAPSPDPS